MKEVVYKLYFKDCAFYRVLLSRPGPTDAHIYKRWNQPAHSNVESRTL